MREVDGTGGSTLTTAVQYFYDEHDRLLEEHQVRTAALNAKGWQTIAGRVPSEHPLAAIAGFFGSVFTLLALPFILAWVAMGHLLRPGRALTRREQRQRLTRAAVIAYILPLFALGPETVNGFFIDLWLRTAYASDCPAPSTCSTLYEYDANGNLIRKLLDADGPSGSGEAVLAEEYAWDAETPRPRAAPDVPRCNPRAPLARRSATQCETLLQRILQRNMRPKSVTI